MSQPTKTKGKRKLHKAFVYMASLSEMREMKAAAKKQGYSLSRFLLVAAREKQQRVVGGQ
jgi:uncharacterized protein (DUF1778 family)